MSRNEDKITKPIETVGFSAHFVFSYGHVILNAGYDSKVDSVFMWEEPY